jgi:hypothetical protein
MILGLSIDQKIKLIELAFKAHSYRSNVSVYDHYASLCDLVFEVGGDSRKNVPSLRSDIVQITEDDISVIRRIHYRLKRGVKYTQSDLDLRDLLAIIDPAGNLRRRLDTI